RCAVYLCNQKEVAALSRNKLRVNDVRADFPIEKVSLSRGLTMNKFEKDFLIYPEYADTDDVRTIQGFTEVLRKSLELTTDREELEKHGSLPDGVRGALNDCTVFSALVPSTYGGLGLGYKDQMKIFENLSLDWNIHANVAVVSSVVNALLLFGSDEIKDKYFPLIVSGKCRPIIAVIDDKGIDSCSEIFGTGRTNALLRIKNTRCVGVNNANIAIMLATSTHHEYCSCYIIDRTELKESDTWEFTRDETFGLKAFDVGLLNVAASISERQLVGKLGQGPEVMDELVSCACLPLAAATIGYSKRLLRDLAAICNKTPSRKENAMVSDETSSQYITTEFALKVYALESASYYLAGLLDERMPVVVDIENALVHKLTQDVLLSSISTTMELAKVQASNPSIRFEKDIRDVVTLLSLVREMGDLLVPGQANRSTIVATKFSYLLRVTSSLKRLFRKEKLEDEFRNPRLTHYIAEHAHPSLQMACQDLEFSISRVNLIISKLLDERGKNIKHDYATHNRLVTVLQNHLAMVSVISRSSRSYCIGLRNSDLELAWATFICSRLSRENWFLLEALNDHFALLRLNPSLLNVGRAIFDMGGYQIESPIEKNW
ncbi:hypothetical protein Angca_008903, partial [Angiostrongylus cantonensis]